ncbi:flagellar biosynthetic protein FliO [Chloroflexi bacterium CFX6]|nr:flagellar biosynthetic protein FliO [Chloroflexi bacterium CFX6]
MDPFIARLRRWFETSSRKQKLTAALFAFSLISTAALLAMNGTSNPADDPLGSTPLYFAGVFAKLIGVLLLIVVCAVLFRRWMQPGAGRRSTRQLQLLETVRLSPKQTLHLISVGGRRLLIGATDQNVSLIAPVETDPNAAEAGTPEPQPALDFGSLLRTFESPSPAGPSK